MGKKKSGTTTEKYEDNQGDTPDQDSSESAEENVVTPKKTGACSKTCSIFVGLLKFGVTIAVLVGLLSIIVALNSQKLALEADVKKLLADQSKSSSLEERLHIQETLNDQLQNTINQLQKDLKSKAESLAQEQAKRDGFNQEKENYEARLKELENVRAQNEENKNQEISRLVKENEALLKKESELLGEVSKLKDMSASDRNALGGQKAELENKLQESERTILSLESQVAERTGELEKAKKHLETLGSDIEKYQKESRSHSEEIGKLSQELQMANAQQVANLDDVDKLQKKLAEKAEVEENLNSEIQKLAEEKAAAQADIEKLTKLIKAKDEEKSSTENEKEIVQSSLSEKVNEIKQLQQTIDSLTSTKTDLESKVSSLSAEAAGLKDKLLKAEKDLAAQKTSGA